MPDGVVLGLPLSCKVLELITADTVCPLVNPVPVTAMPGRIPTVDVTAIIPPTVPTGLNAVDASLTVPKEKLYTLLEPDAPTIS